MNSLIDNSNLILALPEIFLALWLLIFIPLGVYSGGSLAVRQSYFSLFAVIGLLGTFLILLSGGYKATIAFNDLIVSDKLVVYMKSLVLVAGILIFSISERYRSLEKLFIFEYPVLVLFSILGMLIMISSNDFITLYMGLELQSLSLYVLAAMKKDSKNSSEAGLKYFILGAIASGFLLFGVSLIFGITGTTSFTTLATSFSNMSLNQPLLVFAIIMILSAMAFKISIAPFHMWTPDVYEGAPTSITAFFAVVPKIAAFAVLMRILFIAFYEISFIWQQILIVMSILSIFVGAFGALLQTSIKRLMAYSTISNVGYVLLSLSLATSIGLESSIIYITIYTVSTLGVFAFILSMEKEKILLDKISSFSGLSKSHPFYALTFTILLLSLAGLPPLAGFFAKFYIFRSLIIGDMLWVAVIGILGSVVAAYYYLKIIKIMYLDDSEELLNINSNNYIKYVLGFCAFLVISFIFFADSLIEFCINISKAIVL